MTNGKKKQKNMDNSMKQFDLHIYSIKTNVRRMNLPSFVTKRKTHDTYLRRSHDNQAY